jgi:hypothetical protein
VIFEIGGKYRGLGFVKQLIGKKATQKGEIRRGLIAFHKANIKNLA